MIGYMSCTKVIGDDIDYPYEAFLVADENSTQECVDWIKQSFGNPYASLLMNTPKPFKLKITRPDGYGLNSIVIKFDTEEKIAAFKLRFM